MRTNCHRSIHFHVLQKQWRNIRTARIRVSFIIIRMAIPLFRSPIANMCFIHLARYCFLSIFETAFEEIVTHANLRLRTFAQCKYKLKRCSNNECCKQCRYVKFKGTMTEWPVQKNNTQNDTKTRTTSWRNRQLEKLYLCVFRIF